MKKLFLITFIAFFVISCNNETPPAEIKIPQYEEYSTDNNLDNSQDENTYTDNTTTYQPTSTIDISKNNLDERLANNSQSVIFSFKTEQGKTLSLLTDANENYFLYRFGKPDNIEFEYPTEINNDSKKLFSFESYSTNNENLMHIFFVNADYQYTIYYNENVKDPSQTKAGVQVKNLKTKKVTDIPAVLITITGSLGYFK